MIYSTSKDSKSYNIVFTYDSMLIGVDTPERLYLKEKKRLWEKKEPGAGSNLVQMWLADRGERYEPVFKKNFEKYSRVKLVEQDATYTLIVKTTRTEGGWNAGIANQPGEIDGELWIVMSSDKSKIIAKIGFYRFRGKNALGGDFEMTTRVQDAYALAGKGLGDFLKRKSR